MNDAIKNIIINAVESMPDSGSIIVKTDNFTTTTERGLPLPEGKYVKISIRDQGIGIPEEHLSKIFDPYFSTKEMGLQKGMGMGLATTYSIINRHDGHITVESEVGIGTTFTLYLPAHEKDFRKLKPVEKLKPEKPAVLTGRILLMDDEHPVGILMRPDETVDVIFINPDSSPDISIIEVQERAPRFAIGVYTSPVGAGWTFD